MNPTEIIQNSKRNKRIGLITSILDEPNFQPISQLINIFKSPDYKIILITVIEGFNKFSKNSHIIVDNVKYQKGGHFFKRILKALRIQIILGLKLIRHNRDVDVWFSIFGNDLFIPTLIAKLTKKKIIHIIAGSLSITANFRKSGLSQIFEILTRLTYLISDNLIVYSSNIIEEYRLGFFRNKIRIAPHHIIDPKEFFLKTPIELRKVIVGFVGRLNAEKGIMEFIETIKILSKEKIDFIIIGNGPSYYQNHINRLLLKDKFSQKIEYIPWVELNKLNDYYNKLKLLVTPSFHEGLPNVLITAMAAGTPVLCTKVGAIPDVISEGYNGFLLENNNPLNISKKILDILKRDDLNIISKNEIEFIITKFSLDNIRKKYMTILNETEKTHK